MVEGMVNNKTILVCGGAGFIGTHLCKRLLNEGNEVICLDNFFTGRKKNIQKLIQDYPRFEVIRHDITVPIYIDVDEIYHLACPASPIHYQYNPIKTVKTSTIGSLNVLGMAKRTKARVLLASTSEVYGDPLEHPQKESYWGHVNSVGRRGCYDNGKRCAETLFMDYHRQNHVNTRIARIFNTFGEYMRPDDGRVVSNFIVSALKNEPLTIYGDGTHTRSFMYVNDLIDGLVKLMDAPYCEPVNLGNPKEYTVKQLADIIIELTNSKSTIVYEELPDDDPKRRKPDITLAKELLNWSPKHDLIDGLRKTIAYFSNELI